jgi:hypothetical protein
MGALRRDGTREYRDQAGGEMSRPFDADAARNPGRKAISQGYTAGFERVPLAMSKGAPPNGFPFEAVPMGR